MKLDELKAFSKLTNENKELKQEVETAQELQSTLIDDLSIDKVIKVKYRLGIGTRANPVRIITSYWDTDGHHLFDLEEP
ncbi:MAG: hypothetical protein LKF01_00330 [Lactobacillus sp.]|jgi:hypothetical protein|nr:hypothetical protein [Lactobacillus sp.]MCH4067990.1 hypothetical protein [Lactobacillus sp.]MCI1304054.1 hypothetical protein [Lactobacillus sp.]MCI1329920.1 hypothetical protein [Lactobacillus sp.]MCI1399520.1 hypothetical protein [Lactobacillus sp.]